MAETELFDFGAVAREAVQNAVDAIMPKLKGELAMFFKDKDLALDQTTNIQPPFGNTGGSVDLADEWLKQHSSTTSSTTTTGPINRQYCGQRLPCGICRMTNMQCPMYVPKYEFTCSMQAGTAR